MCLGTDVSTSIVQDTGSTGGGWKSGRSRNVPDIPGYPTQHSGYGAKAPGQEINSAMAAQTIVY